MREGKHCGTLPWLLVGGVEIAKRSAGGRARATRLKPLLDRGGRRRITFRTTRLAGPPEFMEAATLTEGPGSNLP